MMARRRAMGAPVARQRGVVMFIALIVMVALSLAAIALVRSVDTTNAVIGNLSFRMASILPGNQAVEKAAAALFPNADIASAIRIADTTADYLPENYYAKKRTDDTRGVPDLLQKKSTFDAAGLTKISDDSTKTEIRYVIDRMCSAVGAPSYDKCDFLLPRAPKGKTSDEFEPPDLGHAVFSRVTIRVDGPQNTTSFLQAMLK